MSSIYTRVSRVADWAGWCSPCEREDRPLVLTRSGPGGVGAWLSGLNDDDRLLLLTCRVCGSWQFVPNREEDDPEVVLVDDAVLETVAEMVYDARSTVAPVELDILTPPRLPAPRHEPAAPPVQQPVEQTVDASVEALLATFGRSPATEAPVPSEPLAVDVPASFLPAPEEPAEEPAAAPVLEAPALEAPVAELPEPRAAVERIVTVPEPDSVTASGFSLEAVAAAAAVLSAARAGIEPSSAADRRKETQDRRHRARRGPTPRRSSDRVAAVRAAAAAETAAGSAPALDLPPVLGLPSGTRQVVLAAAS